MWIFVLSLYITTVTVSIHFGFHLGFPIIPTENACGEYNGHEFFVYERISKPLDNVVTKNTHVSRDDFLNIAIQIFKILQYLFDKNRILKNIDIRDFCLRRTTNGYRVILINQDFYTGFVYFLLLMFSQPFDIDDPTFTSVSVMKGNGAAVTLFLF